MTMIVHGSRTDESSATPTAIFGLILAFTAVFVIGAISLREPIGMSFSSNLLPKISDSRGS